MTTIDFLTLALPLFSSTTTTTSFPSLPFTDFTIEWPVSQQDHQDHQESLDITDRHSRPASSSGRSQTHSAPPPEPSTSSHSQQQPIRTPSMIGAPPMLFDPNQANVNAPQDIPADYEHWVQSYQTGQPYPPFASQLTMPHPAVVAQMQQMQQMQHGYVPQQQSVGVQHMQHQPPQMVQNDIPTQSGMMQPPPQPQHTNNQYKFADPYSGLPPPESPIGNFAFNFPTGQSSLADALRMQPSTSGRQPRRGGQPSVSGRQTGEFSTPQHPMAPPNVVIPATSADNGYPQYAIQPGAEQPSGSEGTFIYSQNVNTEQAEPSSSSSQPYQTFTFAPYSPDHLTAGSATYTPNSEFGALAGSSMSPSSWTGTDDGQAQTFAQQAAGQPSSSAQQDQVLSSPTDFIRSQPPKRDRKPSARGRGAKSSRGQKRPRTSGPHVADSDTQSDEDDMIQFHDYNPFNVSMPPVRGSDTMPTRLCVFMIFNYSLSLFLSLIMSRLVPLYIFTTSLPV